MESSIASKKIKSAIDKALDSKERYCVYLNMHEANCSMEISSHSKIEDKINPQTYTLYDNIGKTKELWINRSGAVYIKEEVFGKKLNRPHQLIKTNIYDTFIMRWENGDYIQVIHGRIASMKIS